MARKNVADAAKAKAEKQKKMVIVLGVVLALALAYGVHTMMSLNKSSSGSRPQPAAAGATTTPAAPTPAPTGGTSALPAAPTLSGTGAPTSTTPSDPSGSISSQLVSAVKAPANVGQLQSFSLFESKDPFNAAGPGATSHPSDAGKPSGGAKAGSSPRKPPKAPPAPPTPPPTSAVISVNGSSESVTTGGSFPSTNPMFQLVALTTSTAKVAVDGGSYADGAATLTLKVGKPVTLVNTADGTRYTIELLPQGTVPTGNTSSSGTSTTTDTTTTTSSSG
jgi:hypothetical protein